MPKFIILTMMSLVIALLGFNGSLASADEKQLQLKSVYSGLSVPWGMDWVGANQLLVTEKSGNLKLINLATQKATKVQGLPAIEVNGQGGLLDVKVSPNFTKDNWIYFTYSKLIDNGESATTLARAQLKDSQLVNWKDLLITQSQSSNGRHYGSRIAFDNNNHIFFSVGDRGERSNGQNLNTHAGTIIRLNLDGSVPSDNPFIKAPNVLNEIWSYGHRNPQGLAFDSKNNRLWAIEHGPRGGDEINLIKKGANYGWPVISYGKEYWGPVDVGEGTHKAGMEQPIKYYVPSIAPSSLVLYQNSLIPKWQGSLLSGSLKFTHLNRVILDKNGKAVKEERLFESLGERIRSVLTHPSGKLYFSTDNGNIYQVAAKGSTPK